VSLGKREYCAILDGAELREGWAVSFANFVQQSAKRQ